MINKLFAKKRTYLFAIISSLLVSQTVNADWLKAYGTKGDDMTSATKLKNGGYAIVGQTGNNNWFSLLDNDGTVLWSKASGKVGIVSINDDGSVNLSVPKKIGPVNGNDYVDINATGMLNFKTGEISKIQSEKTKLFIGKGGKYLLDERDDTLQGDWQTSKSNPDLAFGKVDSNNRLLWSHRYSLANSVGAYVTSVNSGFLLSFNSYEENPETLVTTKNAFFTKLDATGNITPGSTIKISSDGRFPASILEDPDGGFIVEIDSKHDFSLIRLDNNLNYVWGRRYSSPNAVADQLFFNQVSLNDDGTLTIDFTLYRSDNNPSSNEAHPGSLKVNSSNGEVLANKRIQISVWDETFFTIDDIASFTIYGSISNDGQQADADGMFALFSNSPKVEWVKTITGGDYDSVKSFDRIEGTDGYRLMGETASWGAGQTDLLLGEVDKNGNINGCSAIQTMSATVSDAEITVTEIASPLKSVPDPIDKGAFKASVKIYHYPLKVRSVNFPIRTTNICS